jgi:hemerythrin superfamily protein
VSTDAIVLLKDDHKEIRKLCKQFEAVGDSAHAQQNRLVTKILELLTVHTYIENECMYPRTRELVPDLEDDVLESYEKHHVADVLCMELLTMTADDERFVAKTTVLIEVVEHHMEEEEEEWFPKVRAALGRRQLQEIGAEMIELKKKAPRRPSQPSALKKALDALVD